MNIECHETTHFLRLRHVMDRIRLSRSQIYKLMDEDDFPHSFKLSKRAVAWKETDITKWMNTRALT
jgi:prophage regulatory protein